MKLRNKNELSLLPCLLFTTLHIFAYQSGSEVGEVTSDSIDCLSILQQEMNLSSSLWTETHCKKTADAIIELCTKKGVLTDGESIAHDLHGFTSTPLGQQLLSQPNAREHKLFSVNIAGGGHVAIIEKIGDSKGTHWKIFQSWQNEFTLAQWLGIHNWKNSTSDTDFSTFGAGKKISCEQLTGFLARNVKLCQERLLQFKNLGIATPHELEVKSFRFKDDDSSNSA